MQVVKDFILKGSLIGEQSVASVWGAHPRSAATYSFVLSQIQDFTRNCGGRGTFVPVLTARDFALRHERKGRHTRAHSSFCDAPIGALVLRGRADTRGRACAQANTGIRSFQFHAGTYCPFDLE